MKHLRRICLFMGISVLSIVLIYSCQKDNISNTQIPEGQQRVRIRLSDNPVNFDAVNVDIQRVEVQVLPDSCRNNDDDDDDDGPGWNNGWGNGCHHDRHGDRDNDNYSCAVWDTLDIRPGVYNLLDLTNGADTLLASGLTVAGKIKKIRLTLGTSNSVMIDSVNYPLSLWNGYDRITIKLKGEDIDEISPSDLQLWLDFDAGRSIVKISNNRFVLKPYLRIWIPDLTASIKGKVLPNAAEAVVAAIADGDTLIAIPERRDGRFKIRGLKGSTADLFINATANGYKDTTITGISLQAGRETDIGTIQLHQ